MSKVKIIFEVKYEAGYGNKHPYVGTLFLYMPTDGEGNLAPLLKDVKTIIMGESLRWNWGNLDGSPLNKSIAMRVANEKFYMDSWEEVKEAINKRIEEYTNLLSEVKKKNEDIVSTKPENIIIEKEL